MPAPDRIFFNARALCLRLSRWLDGNRDELSPIRIPTEAEQRRRDGTRRRKFLQRLIRMLANRGHGQVAERQHLQLPSRWWGARNWPKLAGLVARVAAQEIPKGLGELSLVTLDGEVCSWERFHNRKQIGSYTGCCPGDKAET